MKSFCLLIIICLHSVLMVEDTTNERPNNFVNLKKEVPIVLIDVRYFGSDNFVGKPVNGYEKQIILCTKQAAQALHKVALELAQQDFRLKVFDGYRPQKAVNHFKAWALDLTDTLTKAKYYPLVPKEELFERNYIAERSSHSRGSTFDLTIVDANGEELDMGTSWDYFGTASWPTDTTVSIKAQTNRKLLANVMTKHGFTPYNEEWWHFTLANEPYPETYFDFNVK